VDGPSQRPTVPIPNSIVIEHEVTNASDLGQVPRDGVAGAEHPAAAPQRVLAQGAGRLELAPLGQGDGEAGRRPQCDRMVRAEHPAAALQGVLAQHAGRLGLTQLDQREDEAGRRRQGGGVVRAEHAAAALQRVLAQAASRLSLPHQKQGLY